MGLPSARGTESSAALCPKARVECWVHPTLYLVLDSLGFQFVFSSDVQPDLGWLYSVIMLDILQGEPPTRFIQYGFLRAISCFTFLLVGCRSYPEISWSQVRGQQVFSLYSVEAANFLFAGSFGLDVLTQVTGRPSNHCNTLSKLLLTLNQYSMLQ